MTSQQLETALFNILERDVTQKRAEIYPRCENEQEWHGSNHGQNATPCNAPNANLYAWKEGGVEFEMHLCDSCAGEKELL